MSIYLSPAQLQCIHIWRNEVHRSCPSPIATQVAYPPPPRTSSGSLRSTTGHGSGSLFNYPSTNAATGIHFTTSTSGLFHSLSIALQPSPPLDMHALIEQPRRTSRWRRWLNLPPKPQHTNMYTNAAPPLSVSLNTPLDQFPDLVPSSGSPSSINAASAACSRHDSPAGADAGDNSDVGNDDDGAKLRRRHTVSVAVTVTVPGVDEKPPIIPPVALNLHISDALDSDDDTYSDSSAGGGGHRIKGSRMIEDKQARLRSAQKLLLKTQQLAVQRMEADAAKAGDDAAAQSKTQQAQAQAQAQTQAHTLPQVQSTPFITL
ncbi:hypothetical protein Cpir12675_003203 [Ceratocystis pirilliformis]|uniref:Uncharacterized protein n=1 Tax=Ceratocystis pirilliformis TaxID=259994 RepID=A0ABR3Z5J8_9PEZI